MKNVIKYLGMAFLLVAMAGISSSCIKDNFTSEEVNTANITVRLDSRAVYDGNALNDEGIKTVRLIIGQGGNVVINKHLNFAQPENEALLIRGIEIKGLKKADTDFYVVVNEESINKNFGSEFAIGNPINVDAFNGIILKSGDNTFPRSDIGSSGLPMQGHKSIARSALTDDATIDIGVTRVVARIDLNIVNETGGGLEINAVNFGKFFPSQTRLGVFDFGSYDIKSFNEGITIPAEDGKNTHRFTYYLYESNAGEGAYTVSLNDGVDYPAVPVKVNGSVVTELLRNNILSITATARSAGWELACSVNPWEKEEINVDFKSELSYFSKGWDEGTILGILENNVIHLDPTKEAVLEFVIQTPNTAVWKAQLAGNQESLNAIEIVGDKSGTISFDDNGNVISQVLKVRITDEYVNSDVEHSVELRVYAEIAGVQYELDLTDISGNSQIPDETQVVNRYTLLQKK